MPTDFRTNGFNAYEHVPIQKQAKHLPPIPKEMSLIPEDILIGTFNFLDYSDLRTAALCSRQWRQLTYFTEFYTNILNTELLKAYPKQIDALLNKQKACDNSSWREPLFVLAKAHFLANPNPDFELQRYKINWVAVSELITNSSNQLKLNDSLQIYNFFLKIKLEVDYQKPKDISEKTLNTLHKITKAAQTPKNIYKRIVIKRL